MGKLYLGAQEITPFMYDKPEVTAPPDPKQVYRDTRPTDWLQMPSDANVADNEMYFLLEVPNSRAVNYGCYFRAITSSGTYDIEFGTTINGVFVADSTYAVTGCASNTDISLSIPMSIFHTAGTGKQILMRAKTSTSFTSMLGPHTQATSRPLRQILVEIKGKGTSLTAVNIGGNTATKAAKILRYFSLLGTNNITSVANMFQYCYSLVCVLSLDTSHSTSFSYMFQYCYTLVAIPTLDTSAGTSFNYAFSYCYSLTSVPQLDTSNGTNFSYMFSPCTVLKSVPQLNTSKGTNLSYMFSGCASLTAIPQLNTSKGTNLSYMFQQCYSLAYADFSGYDFSKVTTANNMSNFTSGADLEGGAKVFLPANSKFPTNGVLATNIFTIQDQSGNKIRYIITDASGMLALQGNATTIFGSNSNYPYAEVYVPDSLYATYAADTYWSTLGTRLKTMSDLPA